MTHELNDRVFIITGASRGIGKAVAIELARAGAHLAINAREEDRLAETARECEALGRKVRRVAADIAAPETARQLVEQATGLGDLFGFVHVAGVARPGPFLWELPDGGFQDIIAASLIGAYQLVRYAAPILRARESGIAVFVGSAAAEMTLPGLGAYCIAKSAEEQLARQLAAEAPSIISFAFRPGVVDTRMQAEAREAQGGAAHLLRRKFEGYQARGELKTPESVARALVRMMTNNPARFQGRVATWMSGES